ncbi:MAG: peptidoglycan editing factor PgeF [Caulobacteraceae bacterium]|nr:peptidoglycan editing factor PgeF [Caulobacteraceae bacterium]
MEGLPILASPLLARASGIRHAFFTRQGGVSEGVYGSLNAGPGSGDDPARVAENRRRAAARLGGPEDRLLSAYQVHSPAALIVEAPWRGPRPEGDALVTAEPALALGALAADCAPVLIADPEARIVAAAHAGWRGALAGVVEAAIEAMTALGAAPARMLAAVGPCIGPDSYEVGLEFAARFEAAAAANARFFRAGQRPDKRLFDLPGYVLSRLAAAGVGQAEWIGCDTFAEEALFFSNRRAVHRGQSDYGRLLSAIALEP